MGEPSLNSPPPVLAPDVVNESKASWEQALRGQPVTGVASPSAPTVNAAIQAGTAPPTSEQPAQKATFEEVPDANAAPGNSVSVQVSGDNAAGGGAAAPGAGGTAAGGSAGSEGAGAAPAAELHSNSEPLVKPVGPTNNQPLPAVDKPAEAPQQINQVPANGNAQVATGANASGKPTKKAKKAPYNKKDESSSKHKKKEGIDKLNPF